MHFVNKILQHFDAILLRRSKYKKMQTEKMNRDKMFKELAASPVDAFHNHFFTMFGNQRFALALSQEKSTYILGFSLLAFRAARLHLFKKAKDYLTHVPISFMIQHTPLMASEVLSREDIGRFSALADTILQSHPSIPAEALADICYALLHLKDRQRAEMLYNLYVPFIDSCDSSKKKLFSGFQHHLRKIDRPVKPVESQGEINIGLLGYKLPSSLTSANIGDYFQTMGMVGNMLLSGMRPAENADDGGDILFDLAQRLPATGKEKTVRFHIFDRDDLSPSPTAALTWLPVFGWMSHPKFRRSFELDLPDNVRPIFISFHLANAELLTDKNVKIFRKYGPVGCRDYTTVRILRSAGIPAFFSGCLTSALDILYPRNIVTGESFAVSHLERDIRPKAHEEYICHSIPELLEMSFDGCMRKADELLRRYVRAQSIRTNLLHCFMPCRAMGTPVTFTHKKPADRRFEGLVDATPKDIKIMKNRIKKILGGVFQAIIEGQSEAHVYSRWKELCQSEMQNTTSYLNKCSGRYPLPVDIDLKEIREQIPVAKSGPSESAALMHVCFAIDNNFTKYFITTALSLLVNSSQPIHLHILTRKVNFDALNILLSHEKCARISQYDCTEMAFDSINLLPHTTLSTMDRLMIPELLHDVKKAIYLDTDILVRKDISALWDISLGDALLAARPSIHKEWYRGVSLSLEIAERYNFEKAKAIRTHLYDTGAVDFPCFNAGVLCMNLDKMRKESLSSYTIALAREFSLHDQFSLNIAARGNYVRISPEWNHFYNQETLEDPSIIHYIGPWKPWNSSQLPFAHEWNGYASLI